MTTAGTPRQRVGARVNNGRKFSDFTAMIGNVYGTRTVTSIEIEDTGACNRQRLVLTCICGHVGSLPPAQVKAHGVGKCQACWGSGVATARSTTAS